MAAMTGGWNLDLTIHSASGLSNVRKWGRKMKVFAQISVTGTNYKWRTPVSYDGETNPKWDVKTLFELSESAIQGSEDELHVKLFCQRTLRDPKYVGEVKLSLKTLFQNRHARGRVEKEYDVYRENETARSFGVVRMWYSFHRITASETYRATSEEHWKQFLGSVSTLVTHFVEKHTGSTV